MPIYDYVCGSCGQRTEVIHGVHAPGPERCPQCGSGPMKKAVHAPAVHFKGTGWAKKERAASARPAAAGSAKPASSDASEGTAGGANASSDGQGEPGGTAAAKPAAKPASDSSSES